MTVTRRLPGRSHCVRPWVRIRSKAAGASERATTAVSAQRSAALAVARDAHPERFATEHDPKILALPTNAWINRPAETSAA